MDLEARAHWVDYAEAKDEMFAYTDIKEAPVARGRRRGQEVGAAQPDLAPAVADPLRGRCPSPTIELPPRQERAYMRPPIDSQSWIPTPYEVGNHSK